MTLAPDNLVVANEAETHFSDILDRVENGELVTITKHGKPVAKLVPIRRKSSAEERKAAIQQIRDLKVTLGGLKIRDLIEEGRRSDVLAIDEVRLR